MHNIFYFIEGNRELKMKITLDLPEELISEAMKITEAPTKTELIKKALKNIIQQGKLSEIKKHKAQIDLKIDFDILRDRSQ